MMLLHYGAFHAVPPSRHLSWLRARLIPQAEVATAGIGSRAGLPRCGGGGCKVYMELYATLIL